MTVAKELFRAIIYVWVVDVWPIGYVVHLVQCKLPFVVICAYSTGAVFLSVHVESVESVTIWIFHNTSVGLHGVLVNISANDITAISRILLSIKSTLAVALNEWPFKLVGEAFIIIIDIKVQHALLTLVCWIALKMHGLIRFFAVEHHLREWGTLRSIIVFHIGQPAFTEFAILNEVCLSRELQPIWIVGVVWSPSKLGHVRLGVDRQAELDVLDCIVWSGVPAILIVLALVVVIANFVLASLLATEAFVWPH